MPGVSRCLTAKIYVFTVVVASVLNISGHGSETYYMLPGMTATTAKLMLYKECQK